MPNIERLCYSVIVVIASTIVDPLFAHPGLHHDIQEISRTLSREPDRGDLLIQRARLLRLDARFLDSLADLDRASHVSPDAPQLDLERGLTLSALRRDSEADAALTRHIEHGSASSVAYIERGHIRARGRNPETALADYSTALEQHPTVDIVIAKTRVLESIGRVDEAARDLSSGMKQLGGPVVIRDELIRIETIRKRFDVAIALIDEVIEKAAVKTEWYLRRGDVLQVAGDHKNAMHAYETAIEEANRVLARRTSAIHLYGRAKSHIALGQYPDAIRDLHAALKRSPRFSKANDLLKQLIHDGNDHTKTRNEKNDGS